MTFVCELLAAFVLWWGNLGHFGETVFPPSMGLAHLSVFKLPLSLKGINTINTHFCHGSLVRYVTYCLVLLLGGFHLYIGERRRDNRH